MSWQVSKMVILDTLYLPIEHPNDEAHVYIMRGLAPVGTAQMAGPHVLKTMAGFIDLRRWIQRRRCSPSIGTMSPKDFVEMGEAKGLTLAAIDVLTMIAKVHAGEPIYKWVWSETPLDEEIDP